MAQRKCFLRLDKRKKQVADNMQSGFKLCGTMYYEGDETGGGAPSTLTIGKNLASISMALAGKVFKVKNCAHLGEPDCHVLVQYDN